MTDLYTKGYRIGRRDTEAQLAARIEALEAQIQEDTVRLDEDAAIMEKATARIAKQKVRIETLEAALHEAFMAMCAYRDSKDEEVFQDAIDALGLAAFPPEQNK